MSLAQRVRDFRYSKGWGPDELANRAEISRTALYQIESGKTELPRAGTLRRIAVALEVPMEDLLEHEGEAGETQPASERVGPARSSRGLYDWLPSEGGPLSMPPGGTFKALSATGSDDARFGVETSIPSRPHSQESIFVREGELMSKLHDLIHSPVGDGVARLIEDLHLLLPRSRPSV